MRVSMIARAALVGAALWAPAAGATEFRALLGGWGYHATGDVNDQGKRYDFADDLDLSPTHRRSLQLELDTPRGAWPDLSLSWSQLGASGDHTETVGTPLPATRTVLTDADFDDWDLVARYPLRFGALRASVGLAVQQLRGDLLIEDSDDAGARRVEHYDEFFPQLHVQLRWRLGAPLVLTATGQGVEYQGDRALEWRAGAELRVMQPLLIELGWQEKRYELDLPDYALDARLRGALLRVGFLYR